MPILDMWCVAPRAYLDVARGELAHRAEVERGMLFRVPQAYEGELEAWLQEQRLWQVEV